MRVYVRPGEPADLPRLTEIYNHFVRHTAVTFDVEPFTVADRQPWFDQYDTTGRYRLLVAGVDGVDGRDGRVVGYATSSRFRAKAAYDTTVETTVYCGPDATGKGVGTALYESLFAALAGADVHRAVAGATMPNHPSAALHRRFGFAEIGVFPEVGRKFDRYWGVLWMSREI